MEQSIESDPVDVTGFEDVVINGVVVDRDTEVTPGFGVLYSNIEFDPTERICPGSPTADKPVPPLDMGIVETDKLNVPEEVIVDGDT